MFLWKIILLSQTKYLVKRVALFYTFANLFNVLSRRQLGSHSAFCIQSVAIYCFGWRIGKTLASHRYVVGTVWSILISFSHNCGHPSLILCQNPTNGSFLKMNCNVESKNECFLLCYVKMYWSVWHLERVFCPCMILYHSASIIWKMLVYWVM